MCTAENSCASRLRRAPPGLSVRAGCSRRHEADSITGERRFFLFDIDTQEDYAPAADDRRSDTGSVVLLDGSDDDVAEITEEWTVDAYEYGARLVNRAGPGS
jgi:hypothetical protein